MKIDWERLWSKFDELDYKLEEKFQNEMASKFGQGDYYYLSEEERWKRQQQLIQKLVTKELAK